MTGPAMWAAAAGDDAAYSAGARAIAAARAERADAGLDPDGLSDVMLAGIAVTAASPYVQQAAFVRLLRVNDWRLGWWSIGLVGAPAAALLIAFLDALVDGDVSIGITTAAALSALVLCATVIRRHGRQQDARARALHAEAVEAAAAHAKAAGE